MGDHLTMPGSTATAVIILESEIYIANVGDSRCIIGRDGKAMPVSVDHMADLDSEKMRIIRAGGVIEDGKINGQMILSRSIGDFEFKNNRNLSADDQIITSDPNIKKVNRSLGCDWLFLASDGIWDVLTSHEIAAFIYERIHKKS